MATLDELAIKYGSDKSSLSHNYCELYERMIKVPPKKILEIGVLHGASIRMWKEYFPESEIHGMDLFIENPIPDIEGVVWHKGNQCDYLLLEQLRNEDFDIIIDDGSHNARDQMITFFGLYNGKPYFIEDIQCNEEDYFSQGLPTDFRALTMFRNSNWAWYDCQSPIVLIQSVDYAAKFPIPR